MQNFINNFLFKKKSEENEKPKRGKSMNLNYNTERSKEPIKKEINEFFAKETAKRSNLGKILYLESKNLLTKRTLSKYKLKRNNFIVTSILQDDFKRIKKYVKNAENCMLDEWLKANTNKPPKIASAWFDYMCSIQGNKEINPFHDIERFFQYKSSLGHGAFLGIYNQ